MLLPVNLLPSESITEFVCTGNFSRRTYEVPDLNDLQDVIRNRLSHSVRPGLVAEGLMDRPVKCQASTTLCS